MKVFGKGGGGKLRYMLYVQFELKFTLFIYSYIELCVVRGFLYSCITVAMLSMQDRLKTKVCIGVTLTC